MAEKKRILVVGGIGKNIPVWIYKAFEVEHYEQQPHFKREIAPKEKPDLVVSLKSVISHKQNTDGRKFAEENKIPFIMTDGGWSMAVQRAIESGYDWFAHEIDKARNGLKPETSEEADTVLERAWEGAYKREYERANALEKRLKKDRLKLESALTRLESSERKENAATRVISEIREAAKVAKAVGARQSERQKEILQIYKQLLESREALGIRSQTIDELKSKLRRLFED